MVPGAAPEPADYHKVRMAHLYELAASRFASAAEFAQLALRSVLIAHGGALIGLVTFIGTGQRSATLAAPLAVAFGAFGAGLLLALTASAMAYFTQSAFALQESEAADQTYYENLGNAAKAEEAHRTSVREWQTGSRWEMAALICFGGCLIAFIVGAWASVQALTAWSYGGE